jgi:hypothetical protein
MKYNKKFSPIEEGQLDELFDHGYGHKKTMTAMMEEFGYRVTRSTCHGRFKKWFSRQPLEVQKQRRDKIDKNPGVVKKKAKRAALLTV